jgi:hypothetical protein
MGIIFEETITRKIDKCEAVFTLSAESYNFDPDNENSSFTCRITVGDEIYIRLFLMNKFVEKHYLNFIRKFCSDPVYREQFNSKLIIQEKSTGEIDPDIRDLIDELNSHELITKYSCQGTDQPWRDRPGYTDSHSEVAYIVFKQDMPTEFYNLLKDDSRLIVCVDSIHARYRKYNKDFPEIVRQGLHRYLCIT